MKKLGEANDQNSRKKQKVEKKRNAQQDPVEEEKEVPVKTRLDHEPIELQKQLTFGFSHKEIAAKESN